MNETTLKDLPSVDKVLLYIKDNISLHDKYIKYLINRELELLRVDIKKGEISKTSKELFEYVVNQVHLKSAPSLKNVINGTGIVLHTGFGRAPFYARTLKKIADRMEGYVNLEFDLVSGKRGDRQAHIREHLSAICGSESALVVNNNAAAVMLAINGLAQGGDVVVSRGQLVEIGGSFRIPDIIGKSGANLVEVGTTNRTHIQDYEKAITKKTKLILWVHTSNYVVKGFTKNVPLNELVLIGKRFKIPVMVDWGSGALLDMRSLKLANEIPVNKIMNSEPDILTFSGDKLIGGPQAGVIIGKNKYIKLLQKNTLYRVLRSDKISIGLLEHTLRSYRSNSFTKDNFSLKMLTTSQKTLKNRGKKIIEYQSKKKIKQLGINLEPSNVEAGSGSLPDDKIESMALAFRPRVMKVYDLAKLLRCGSIPVIGYTSNNTYYIDLKAVLPNQIIKLAKAIKEI